MSKCGLCLTQDKNVRCDICSVGICYDCKLNKLYRDKYYILRQYIVCKLCSQDIVICDSINCYKYCKECDNVSRLKYFGMKQCIKCNDDSVKNDRQLLPHYKAAQLIEEIYYIKGIAQIIFDYYYEPRRYFPDEI